MTGVPGMYIEHKEAFYEPRGGTQISSLSVSEGINFVDLDLSLQIVRLFSVVKTSQSLALYSRSSSKKNTKSQLRI